jgi:hypothetical protein
MAYWPLFGYIALMPLLGRAWAERLKTHPGQARRWIIAVALFPVVLAALVYAQARFGLFADSRGRLLGLFEAKHDVTGGASGWDQIASELERRGLLNEPRNFLFTDSWDRSARGKVPVTCYNVEPRSYAFWSRPEDWVGRDGVFIESTRVPDTFPRYGQFFARYESIGSVQIFRRGIFVREVYLYRGTNQDRPFPFDGRVRELTLRGQNERGSTRSADLSGRTQVHRDVERVRK